MDKYFVYDKTLSRNKISLIDRFSSDPHLLDLLLSPQEEAAIEKLNEDKKILNSITVALQRENLDLSKVRMLFNETLKNFRNSTETMNTLPRMQALLKANTSKLVFKNFWKAEKMRWRWPKKFIVDAWKKWRLMTRIFSLKRMRMISLQLYYRTAEEVRRFTLRELSVFATDFVFNRAIFQYGRLHFKCLSTTNHPEHLEEQLFLKANVQFWNMDTVVDVLNKWT